MAESPLGAGRLQFALAAGAAAAFARAPFGSFHADDYLLFQDSSITAASGFGGIWHLITTRPLTWFSFWLNYQAFGTQPLSWHLLNLLLHIGCTLLLYSCLRRLIQPIPALVAAALFAIHPLQVEPVAWVFARATLLCALFCLLTLHAWLDRRPGLALVWFALALAAKEECVFFPLFLALLLPQSARALAAMLALAAATGARAILATKIIAGSGAGFSSSVSASAYLLSQGTVILRYARLIVLPLGLNFDPDLHPPAWSGIAGWFALLGVAALCVKYRRQWPAARWFLGGIVILLASSSIFPADDLAADRRLYLPFIALAPALALALSSLRVPKAVLFGLAAVLVVLTFARTRVWESELSLWTDTVEKSPAKLRPRIQLARALPPKPALLQLDAATAIHPGSAPIAAEKGRIHLQTNRPDLAIADFGQAAAAQPSDPQLWNSLGGAFAVMGQQAAARRAFEHALRLDPCHADARRNLDLEPCRNGK